MTSTIQLPALICIASTSAGVEIVDGTATPSRKSVRLSKVKKLNMINGNDICLSLPFLLTCNSPSFNRVYNVDEEEINQDVCFLCKNVDPPTNRTGRGKRKGRGKAKGKNIK